MKMLKNALSLQKLIEATAYALEGVVSALYDASFLRLVLLGVVLGPLLTFILWPMSEVEILVIIIAFVLPLIAEIINTAIEAVVDLASPEQHPLAKKAKDRAAGATFIALVASSLLIATILISHFVQ